MNKDNIDYTDITCDPPTPDHRFVLKKNGSNPLFVIGLNPSLASEYGPDRTVRKAMEIKNMKKWEGEHFEGFVMYNLYPLRTPYPDQLPEAQNINLVEKNAEIIENELSKVQHPCILAAWGNDITELKRDYLYTSLQLIIQSLAEQSVQWLHFGELTKDGHPRHPLYTKNTAELSAFDIDEYMDKIDKYMKKLK